MESHSRTDRPLPVWLTAPLVIGALIAIAVAERRRPLRRHTDSKEKRLVRNSTLSAMSGIVVQVADAPLIEPLIQVVHRRNWGLLRMIRMPPWLEVSLAVLLLDHAIYWWHVMLHRVPLLWRFHLVHHTDLDLDLSTALRFHFGEMLLSVPMRAALVAGIGPSRFAFSVWQTLFGIFVMFHHSEIALPPAVERRLVRWVVTPRMHGIHHSIIQSETESNWSSGFAFWDYLHGTIKLDVPQQAITIGVPAYRISLPLAKLAAMPFERQRPAWQLPEPSADVAVKSRQALR